MHGLSLTLWLLAATPEPSQVSSVVVFPDRAQVTRAQAVSCAGQPLVVRFDALPPAADPVSFRARAQGGTAESLVATERTRQAHYGAERERLEKRRLELERQLGALEDTRARSEKLDTLGTRFHEVALARIQRELSEPKPDARTWTTALDNALTARMCAAAEREEQAGRLRTLQRELAEVRSKETRLTAAAGRLERQVEIQLDCRPGTQVRVELSYVVGGAAWRPIYEARADEQARAVELITSAIVTQSTGEDWKGARLALSTAMPDENATPPELQPLEVWVEARKEERKVLVRRDEYQEHAKSSGASAPAEGKSLSAVSQGLSVQLTVPEPAEVRGDGSEVRLRVARTRLPASFAWRTVPKLYPVVFRVARLTNGAPFPLLPGPVDLFRHTGFIGRQPLERVAQGAPFELTFGIEESLRADRQVVEEVEREKGLFGGTRRFRYAYRFEVANYRKSPEELELAEHLPVSELDDVKVELDTKKTAAGYTLDAADGIATWKLKLAPAEKRELSLTFYVDVPSSYDSGG